MAFARYVPERPAQPGIDGQPTASIGPERTDETPGTLASRTPEE